MYKHLFSCLFLLVFLNGCKKEHPVSKADIQATDGLLSSSQKPLSIKGNVYFFGDSITEGLTNNGITVNNWVALVSMFTGLNGYNLGIAGTVLESRINGNEAVSSMYSRCDNIPVKKADDKYLFFAYGMNDVGNNYPDLNPDQFTADYQYVINNAFKKGWQAHDIVILNIYYCNESGFLIYQVNPPANRARQNLFNNAIKNIARNNNTRFIDIYSYMENNGAAYLICPDGIHPNDDGYAVIARGVEEALRGY
jgi:lysophospholipase L1-like esterase